MSVANISKSAFVLEPVKSGGYELQIKFLDSADSLISSRKFLFSQQTPPSISREEGKVSRDGNTEEQGEELLDVYSQNGECTSPDEILTKLFKKGDVKGVKSAAGVVKATAFKGPTILVLDLKAHDLDKGYREQAGGTIEKCEDVVCDFFKKKTAGSQISKEARQVQSLLTPDFVLCEGRLKVDLLKGGGFSASEIDYFHTRSGAQSLCQTAEFFMNAFKFGEMAQGEKGNFLAGKYIVPVSGRLASFKPCAKSTVLYPALYAKLYSPEGEFAKTLSTVFNVSGKLDAPSKITTMSMVRKS